MSAEHNPFIHRELPIIEDLLEGQIDLDLIYMLATSVMGFATIGYQLSPPGELRPPGGSSGASSPNIFLQYRRKYWHIPRGSRHSEESSLYWKRLSMPISEEQLEILEYMSVPDIGYLPIQLTTLTRDNVYNSRRNPIFWIRGKWVTAVAVFAMGINPRSDADLEGLRNICERITNVGMPSALVQSKIYNGGNPVYRGAGDQESVIHNGPSTPNNDLILQNYQYIWALPNFNLDPE